MDIVEKFYKNYMKEMEEAIRRRDLNRPVNFSEMIDNAMPKMEDKSLTL